MNRMTTRILSNMIEPDAELELEMALRMTDVEVRASLAAQGVNVTTLERQARAMFGIARGSRRGFIALGGAGAVLGPTVLAIIGHLSASSPVMHSLAASIPPETPEELLRDEAIRQCAAEHWQPCLDKLDEARAIDDYGESQGRVIDARAMATLALAHDGGKHDVRDAVLPSVAPR